MSLDTEQAIEEANQESEIETCTRFRNLKNPTDFLRCLIPLLDALNWNGTDREIVEAMPVEMDSMDLDGFMGTMANLNFEGRTVETRLDQIDARFFPCLFLSKEKKSYLSTDRPAMVIIRDLEEYYMAFSGNSGTFKAVPFSNEKGTIVFFKPVQQLSSTLLVPQKYWFWKVILRFLNVLVLGAILTAMLAIFSFISPLFIMAIYDQVLTSDTGTLLIFLGAGVLIFMAGDICFRLLRAYLFNFVSVRLGNIAGIEILRRILYLPPEYTESASTGSQLSRIRDFDSIQSFFGGPGVVALYDLPFTIILIVGMIFISGNLALVPIASIVFFIIFGLVTRPFMERAIEEASSAGARRHEFIIDLLSNYRAVKLSGSSDLWSERYREISADGVMNSYSIVKVTSVINTGTQFLVNITGLLTMTVGIFKVLAGEMSSGALMASILLVWRILAPLRTGFGVLNQIGKIQKSIGQIDRLMNMGIEKTHESSKIYKKQSEGEVAFSQVSMRYSADSNPALLGISFAVSKGEVLVITGQDGNGKTTILKLLMGLFRPQTGRIIIDDMNLRQLDPISLRHSIAYSPQENEVFDGTISENLLLAKPEATDEELELAVEQAGILTEIKQMENGMETVLNPSRKALSRSFTKGLALGQMYLRDTALYLVDEPDKGLAPEKIKYLIKELRKLKRKATLIIVTKNRDLFEIADRILWLENNRVKLYASAHEVIKRFESEKSPLN